MQIRYENTRLVRLLLTAVLAGILGIGVGVNTLAGEFPEIYDTEPDTKTPRLAPLAAAEQFKVPDGFKVTLFAGEPDVRNPVALTWDSRGRLWVAENYTYADRNKKFDRNLRDRVLIFEDADGDGRFDSRRVFTEQVQFLTSVEVGFGGVWLTCSPHLLFIPDANHDDVPDGAPQVMLDGFSIGTDNYHTMANGLRWGPDGWLYGRCGASSPGLIGTPGTSPDKRVPLNGGIWRFHPRTKVFEVLAHGTTNPWGMDWNDVGETFFTNTVTGHFWHLIPGAHFRRSATVDPNPYAYVLMEQHADHQHFANKLLGAEADSHGGGHAHCGLLIYSGDNWPAPYRGRMFTLNLHGRRINSDRIEREGSGYVSRHEADFAFAADLWFRGLELSCGPDGGVFALDWSDVGECHEHNGIHRSSGRIFKIAHGTPKRSESRDLAALSPIELVRLHEHTNEWYCRMARLQLLERARANVKIDAAFPELNRLIEGSAPEPTRIRALCTLNVLGGITHERKRELLRDRSEHVRVWALRFLTDELPLDTVMGRRHPQATDDLRAELLSDLTRAAREDAFGLMRLMLVSAMQRLPHASRKILAEPLLMHAKDASDHNIPIMAWYGLMPLAESAPADLARLGAVCKFPLTRRLIARRLAESIRDDTAPLDILLNAAATDAVVARDVLNGMSEGLQGLRKAPKPARWDALAGKLAADAAVGERVRELSLLFGDGRALDEVKRIALDAEAPLAARRSALQTLIESRPPDLREICENLLQVRFLNATAAKGLALFDDAAIGVKLAKSYRNFHPTDRGSVIETLVSRPTFAVALLEEIGAGRIPRGDLPAFQARQISSFNDESISKRLTEVWGQLREADDEKRQLITGLKTQLTTETLSAGDKSRGRAMYNKVCASCHSLYGEGGRIGPDLTGSGRADLSYLLDNIVDPSAVVGADFRMTIVILTDGRVLNGIVAARTERTLTLQTPTERITIEKSEIKKTRESPQSLMPEGLLQALTAEEVRDLFAYLMHPTQVPLAEGK
ncbi:MAG TPA: PVC-type heme-binding CxxCH protein [Planctomycetota bacterium]|nr:PVC-type heme-binding CxxCH protein [Planctomycetota bacterium]